MARKTARQVAMQLIYQYELGGEGVSSTIEESMDKPDLNADDMAYIQAMLDGTGEKQQELDELIGRYAVGWSLERIAKVDLSILRLALYEMLFCESIPQGVSINEAIELAHTFSTPEAASFINGILGSVSRAPKEE
ncbi:MAG: transcription antitermination factor NusB [Candidatus Spyradocola sp.]|nr:transcription antitermination factor NusB [Candidatus Spyradocola sp.]